MRNRLKRLAALVAVATLFTAAVASAAETGVTRLVFEKSAKMKKIETTLFLSFRAGESGALRCGVVARFAVDGNPLDDISRLQEISRIKLVVKEGAVMVNRL